MPTKEMFDRKPQKGNLYVAPMALILAVAAFAAPYGVSALDATWVATNSAASANWYDTANWIDSGGNTPELPPTNTTDTATLAALPHEYAIQEPVIYTPQTISVDPDSTNCNPTIASLAGERSYRLEHTRRQSGLPTKARQMRIGNPDAFLGYLSVGDSRASYAFGATSSYSPLVNNLNPYRRVGIEVVEAGTTVRVERVACDGIIEKTGSGSLSLKSTTGTGNGVYLTAGSLELSGDVADDEIDSILSAALLHLDASVASTLETNMTDAAGNVCVTRWNDVRGNGRPYATTNSFIGTSWYQISEARPPYIAEETSPTGLRMVSFGSIADRDGDSLGPTNCLLQLSSSFAAVREVFAVILAPGGMSRCTVLGDTSETHFVHYGSSYFGSPSIVDDLMLDGKHVLNGISGNQVAAMTNAFVSAVGTAKDCKVSLLGSDRYYASRTGGFRLGEVILLGEHVTDVQRQRISRRLAVKWLGEPDVALGHVIAGDGTSLSVPDGRTARVGSVFSDSGTLVKEGGGTLSIGNLHNSASAAIEVKGGKLAFAAETPVDSSAPAPGADIWLDATKTSSFADANTHEGSAYTHYGTWRDCRDGVNKTATWPGLTTNEPFLVENAAGQGLHAFSFGLSGAKNGSWMKLPGFDTDAVKAFAGFIVCRPNIANLYYNIFGSSTIEMRRETTKSLLSATYVQVRPYSAIWSVNGEITDPLTQCPKLQQTNDFMVISFSATEASCVNAICKDRYAKNAYLDNCGGLQIGELILYDHRLSEAERVGTEAYLMNKWLGAAHPADLSGGRAVKTVSFATNVAVSISSKEALSIGKLSGGDGAIVKGGAGVLTVGSIKNDVTSLDVREGVLAMSPTALDVTPRFRFDASAEGTVEYYIVDNGDGTSRTNVTRWLDADGNGIYATVPATFDVPGAKNGALIFTNPTPISVETRSGIVKPAIDFGPKSGYYTTAHHEGTAGMKICAANGRDIGGANRCIREAFIVWQDRPDCSLTGYGYSHLLNDSSDYHYHRNGTKILTDNAGTQSGTKNGYIAVDGTQVAYNTAIDANVHVVNFAHTNMTAVNRIVWDRTSNAGGARVFEMICYTNELTMAQRKTIERALMNKWLGTAAPVYTNSYSSVSVAPSATLRMAATDAIAASTVRAGGTFEGVAAVSGVDSLTIPCEDGIPVASVQSIPFAFADGVVSVTLDGFDAKAFSHAGLDSMTIFEAPSISGNVTFALTNETNRRYPARLTVSGGKLILFVRRPGFVMDFR